MKKHNFGKQIKSDKYLSFDMQKKFVPTGKRKDLILITYSKYNNLIKTACHKWQEDEWLGNTMF